MNSISEIDDQRSPQPAGPVGYERIVELRLVKQRFEAYNQTSTPKIQGVPVILRQNAEFAEYCSPKMISFGPIHHNKNENLKQGEDYKLLWTSMYIDEYSKQKNSVTFLVVQSLLRRIQDENSVTDLVAQSLLERIQHELGELKKLFTEDAIGTQAIDEDLAWMLFVDGCSLLYFMENVDSQNPEALKLKLDQMMYIWRDIILLENQLPRRLLELLNKEGADLDSLMGNFVSMGVEKRSGGVMVDFTDKPKPIHILDFARSFFISDTHDLSTHKKDHDVKENGMGVKNHQCNQEAPLYVWLTYKNIRDLKAAGIRVKASKGRGWTWSNISFTSNWFSGELRLPVFVFNDISPYFFRNLIAYEMCPDFRNTFECCSFFSFMESLIDSAEDVKELRLAGVIQNLLGTDEELAKLFIDVGHDLPAKMVSIWSTDALAYSKKYIQVKKQIEQHYRNKWKTWLAEAYNTYFRSPWSILAFGAAAAALALTAAQTWYNVHPKNPS